MKPLCVWVSNLVFSSLFSEAASGAESDYVYDHSSG